MRERTIIIAEAGVNHNGSLDNAKKLIDVAAEAGADYVKFQTFKAEKMVTALAEKAGYQQQNMNDGESTQFSMLKKLELSNEMHRELLDYCRKRNILFLSTGFDEESVDFLDALGIDLFKIPSGEITNKPYLQHIARKAKPVILSTGMAKLREVKEALYVMTGEGFKKEMLTILHCNTEYPTPMRDVNLRAMTNIQKALNVRVGYSDHTLGIEVAIAAVALGAVVIEKHFTLDRKMPGPDHKASLEPKELKQMIKAIRNVEEAISGNGIKAPSPSEMGNMTIARKSMHYSRSLKKGHVIVFSDFIMKRPGNGISPMYYEQYIGKVLKVNVTNDQMLKKEDFE